MSNTLAPPPDPVVRPRVRAARPAAERAVAVPDVSVCIANWNCRGYLRTCLAALLRWTGLFRKAYDDYRRDGFDPDGVRRVDGLMGAAVLMPRMVYQQCGGWDEGFRFGVEDVELSDRVGREKALVHLPGVEIVHFGRVSSRRNVTYWAT